MWIGRDAHRREGVMTSPLAARPHDRPRTPHVGRARRGPWLRTSAVDIADLRHPPRSRRFTGRARGVKFVAASPRARTLGHSSAGISLVSSGSNGPSVSSRFGDCAWRPSDRFSSARYEDQLLAVSQGVERRIRLRRLASMCSAGASRTAARVAVGGLHSDVGAHRQDVHTGPGTPNTRRHSTPHERRRAILPASYRRFGHRHRSARGLHSGAPGGGGRGNRSRRTARELGATHDSSTVSPGKAARTAPMGRAMISRSATSGERRDGRRMIELHTVLRGKVDATRQNKVGLDPKIRQGPRSSVG